MPTTLRDDMVARLGAAGDPERAEGQQRYMKSSMPYHGVVMADLRRIARAAFAEHPIGDADEWEAQVLELWRRATHREQRYAAIELAEHPPYRRWLDPTRVPMVEEMIVTGAWWDYVDRLAGVHMGHLLVAYPDEIRPLLWRWATDDDLWRRRTSIIAQLRRKADTDTALLFHAIEASSASTEFFLRKAIGWALREYSKTAPDEVIAYVTAHTGELSGLSTREALKVVRKAGRVVDIG